MLLKDLISKGCLRLALIDVDDLLNVVRSSILFSSNADICDKYILDAISNKRNETKIAFRGTLVPSDNIATIVKEVPVVNGLNVVVPLTTCPHRSQTTGAADIRIDANAVCDICSEAAELWVCLTCYKVHCGRYVRGHALSHHFSEPTHAMSLSLANFSVWCYPCEAFVHNKVLIPAKPFARYA
ncbi:unnamed protein product [Nippostrongylus brasiliensis]|uniref:UBP-type domain-containing protein n=1 Tax=Nippostrongylus brasiliensis TaxID=27835 RepID=A0A158QWW1_NIPBR|nr:unnamed protein product [Nippostrongylus brasiliensis]